MSYSDLKEVLLPYVHQPQKELPSQSLVYKIARGLRGNPQYGVEISEVTNERVTSKLTYLDSLRIGTTQYSSQNISAHQLAAKEIVRLLNSETQYRVMFVTSYGSYARGDPIREEDVDLNIFVEEKPRDIDKLKRLNRQTREIIKNAIAETSGLNKRIEKELHAPNFYDLNDIKNFMQFAFVFSQIISFEKREIEEKKLVNNLEGKLSTTQLKRIKKYSQGYSLSVRLYPSLTSSAMPFQIIAYPEELWDADPWVSSNLNLTLDEIRSYDPIFRSQLSDWLDFDTERLKERLDSVR